MERDIKVKTDKVTIIKGDNWNSITSIDFGGADVEFSGQTSSNSPFSGITAITSISNATITNSGGWYMFSGDENLNKFTNVKLPNMTLTRGLFQDCKSLEDIELEIPKSTNMQFMFNGCTNLKRANLDLRKITTFVSAFTKCINLAHVEITTRLANKGWTQSNFNTPSSAPCNQYRYVAEVPQEPDLVKLVFTSAKKMGFKGYQIQFGEGANRFSAITQTIDGLELYWNEDWDGSDLTPQANNVEIILGTLAQMNDNNKPITLTNDSNFDIVVHFNYYSAEGISVPSKSSKVVTATIGQDAQSPSRFNGGYGVLSVSE